MKTSYILPIVATLALGTAAFAADQTAPARGHHWRMDKQDMAQRFKNHCKNRYARTVGTMAYLETRLDLTAQQKPAFERWKGIVLSSAKSASDACLAMTPPAQKPGLVEQAKHRQKRLEMRLSGLKAQMPALESLTAALDQKQDRILERAVHKMMRRGPGRHGFGHGHHRGGHHGHHGMQGAAQPAQNK